MYTIHHNGEEIPAYALIMRKENALDILRGTKKIETRNASEHYDNIFLDKEIIAKNEQAVKEGRDEDWQTPLRTDVGAIHFYSTGAPWTLDVRFDEILGVWVNDEGIKFLQDEYGFHDFDDELGKWNDVPDEEKPYVYVFHLTEILGHKGLKP